MRLVLGYVTALCLLVLIVCQSIIIPTFFLPFFRQFYANHEIAEYIGTTDEELMYVTVELLDYMRARRDNLDGIRAQVGWVEQDEFFSQRDKDHMLDVRVLYDRLFMVRNVAFFAFIGLVCLMAITKTKVLFYLSRCSREVMTVFLLLAGIIAVVIAIDFDNAFEMFHHIFFDNDLWILTPPQDRLIMMVPNQFFINISIFIGSLMAAAPVIAIIAATIYLRREANRPGYGRF